MNLNQQTALITKTLLLSFSLMLMLGCSQQKTQITKAGITFCSESSPASFNPQLDTSSTTADASSHQVYDRLLEFNTENGEIEPGLASSWLVSNDGLNYTFQLRKGVKFHDTAYFTPTRNFNADDVIFSIDRWRVNSHPYHDVSGGNYPYFQSLGLKSTIKDVTRVNGYRVEISLYKPDSSFLANLATDFSVILSAEYAMNLLTEGSPSELDTLPIGTGPYKFVGYRKDQFIRYQRHSDYFLDTIGPENLVFDITPKSSLRVAKLITGECDAVAFPSQNDLEVIREREDLTLLEK